MADVCAAKNKHYRKYSTKNLLEEADLAALLTAHRESKLESHIAFTKVIMAALF
jgi:hypothetical protein